MEKNQYFFIFAHFVEEGVVSGFNSIIFPQSFKILSGTDHFWIKRKQYP